jgi:hypothetical protein
MDLGLGGPYCSLIFLFCIYALAAKNSLDGSLLIQDKRKGCLRKNQRTSHGPNLTVLVWILLILVLLLLDESLEFRKELFNQITVWRIWWRVQKLYACISTYLLDLDALSMTRSKFGSRKGLQLRSSCSI